MAQRGKLNRREFLKTAGGLAAAATLAACSPAAKTAAPAAPAATEAPKAAAAPLTGNLTFWMMSADKIGEDIQDRFNALNNGITVKWELGDFDSNTKIMAALAANNPPPVHHLGRWQTGDMAVRNAIVPLDDFIASSSTFKWDNLWNRLQADCTMWGKKWTVPLSTDTRALFYNKKALAEAGFSKPPDTLEELLAMAPKLTKKDSGGRMTQVGFTPSFANPPQFLMFCSLLWCKGGAMIDKEMKKITIASDEGVAAMQYLKQLMDAQGGYKDAVALTANISPAEGQDAFTMGVVATMMMGGWVFTTYDKTAKDLDYDIVAGPKFEGKDVRLNYDGGGSWYIFKHGNQQAMAWKFIETVMQDSFLIPLADKHQLLPGTKSATAEWQKTDKRRPIFASTADTCNWIPVFSGTLETLSALSAGFDNILISGNDIKAELEAAQTKMQVVLDRHNSFPPPV